MNIRSKKFCNELYRLLYQTKEGKIYRNGINENLLMIEFGNMFLTFSKANFVKFKKFITAVEGEDIKKLIIQPTNKIVIQPMKSVGCYAFTEPQFIELQELILKAFDLMEIEDEIDLILSAS